MNICAFGGLQGSGKSAATEALIAEGWLHLKFADPIWDCLEALDIGDVNYHVETLGRERAKREYSEIRRLLQRIGTEMGRNVISQNVWVNHMNHRLDKAAREGDWPGVVISDLRFRNEAELLRNQWTSTIILIERPGVQRNSAHSSENLDWEPDHTILNNADIETLHTIVRGLVL